MKTVLVINAGSSSIKFQVFNIEYNVFTPIVKGQMDGIGVHPKLKIRASDIVATEKTYSALEVPTVAVAMKIIQDLLPEYLTTEIDAVGHRVVHGGPIFSAPVIATQEVVDQLKKYIPLAPLHQPNNLAPVEALFNTNPDLKQVLCFDTAFHRGHKDVAEHFAIPTELFDEGVRRYGFHGLSYEYIIEKLKEIYTPIANQKLIVAHLGSGVSMCAINEGKSVETTLGFSTMDGMPMSSRPGQFDPGIILYLMEEKGWDTKKIQNFLYKECGLKGLCGCSDMRDIEKNYYANPKSKLALDYFVYRVTVNIGMLAAALGGLDALIFTAGIGQGSPLIRARIMEGMKWLGVKINHESNIKNNKLFISEPDSKIKVLVINTDEELMISKHVVNI